MWFSTKSRPYARNSATTTSNIAAMYVAGGRACKAGCRVREPQAADNLHRRKKMFSVQVTAAAYSRLGIKNKNVEAGLKRLCRGWCRRSAAHDYFPLFRGLNHPNPRKTGAALGPRYAARLTSSRRVAASLTGYSNCLFHDKTFVSVATQSLKASYPSFDVQRFFSEAC